MPRRVQPSADAFSRKFCALTRKRRASSLGAHSGPVLRKEEGDLRATCEVTAVLQAEHYVEVKAVRREQLKASSSPKEECWELTDSSVIRAKFVIGADGRGSHVRQSLGIRTTASPT